MKRLYTLIIKYANGSEDRLPFEHFHSVQDKYRNGISYSNRVARVEVEIVNGGSRAIWDSSWTDESKYAGLSN